MENPMPHSLRRTIACLLLAAAASAQAADVEVKAPWARATVRAQKTGSAFMELKSVQGATLLGAASPVAGAIELHEMKMEGDVMKMRELKRLPLAAGRTVALTPSGYHLMLFDLRQQLKAGERFPLVLDVERSGRKERVEVSVEVRGIR
jgi:hypothetical protein